MDLPKGSPSGILNVGSKSDLQKTKSKVGFAGATLSTPDRDDKSNNSALRFRINEYSGQLNPNKIVKPPMDAEGVVEDVRNPVIFKSNVDLKKTDFDLYDATELVLGPTTTTPNYSYFTKRIGRLYIFMLCTTVIVAFLISHILYAHFILPPSLYARDVIIEAFAAKKAKGVFHCSIPPILMLLTMFYNVAVLQFNKAESWKKFAPLRWAVFFLVEIYLLMAVGFYLSLISEIEIKLDSAMQKDFDYKYKDVKNDPSISSVYRWVHGSRFEHVQLYYQCCGIHSWKDWKPVMDHWHTVFGKDMDKFIHGNLCNPESARYAKNNSWIRSEFHNSTKICQTPFTCWSKGRINDTTVKVNQRRVAHRRIKMHGLQEYTGIEGIHEDHTCIYEENVMAFSVISVYTFTLSCLTIFSSYVFWKTKKVIDVADKMQIDMYTRPQFEECL